VSLFSKNAGISKCRYFICPNCETVYTKDEALKSWSVAVQMNAHVGGVSGTRTCNCGHRMQVSDIYSGKLDIPKRMYGDVPQPVFVG